MSEEKLPTFADFNLIPEVLAAVRDVGYETPTPIQVPTIPHLLAGRDVVGQAQTGTGKTAAFALPLLSRLDLKRTDPQILVLTPTRELAIQVAEAFQSYASHLRGFQVLPVYGGQDYAVQLRQLKRGVHVIVGTPGRLMDHMRRGTLKLTGLSTVVLDEADEMLRMGFIEDVEWILSQTPPTRQVALFSATMPSAIRRIAQQYLRDPAEITIKLRTTTAETIRQRYWIVTGVHKLDALTRLLETEPFEGMLVFVRTRIAAVELAERLQARGYATSALNGDMPQKQRELTISRLKSGALDILVATDVAARGLDVERISHVINFDIPNDTEAYVHRDRPHRPRGAQRRSDPVRGTARAAPVARDREATRQRIEPMELPSAETVNDKRIAKFTQRITDTLATARPRLLSRHHRALSAAARRRSGRHRGGARATGARRQTAAREGHHDARQAAVARLGARRQETSRQTEKRAARTRARSARGRWDGAVSRRGRPRATACSRAISLAPSQTRPDVASANIGRIEIYDAYSTIELPAGMPKEIFRLLKKVWVSGRQLDISKRRATHRR